MIITKTPVRISFFGGGTDYPTWVNEHGGAVLNTTIDKYCSVFVRTSDNPRPQPPLVLKALEYLGITDSLDIDFRFDVPARSGLGTSSSLAVGLLHALHVYRKDLVTREQTAREAIHLERNLLHENVGSQDQVAAAYGGINKLVFYEGGFRVEMPAFPAEYVRELDAHMMVFFSGSSRFSSIVAGTVIATAKQKEKEFTQILEMVDEGIALLKAGRIYGFGNLLHQAWQLKRTLSLSITTHEIDEMYDVAREAGAIGGKMLGAGGGGSMLFVVPIAAQPSVKEALAKYLEIPFRFEVGGTRLVSD